MLIPQEILDKYLKLCLDSGSQSDRNIDFSGSEGLLPERKISWQTLTVIIEYHNAKIMKKLNQLTLSPSYALGGGYSNCNLKCEKQSEVSKFRLNIF